MPFSLLPATPEHLRTVLQWVTCAEDLKLWGGDRLTWPPDVEKTWREIGAQEGNAFTLVDDAGALAGFGQALARSPGTVHLGRIIVSPQLRGAGVGRALVEQLIAAALDRHHPGLITLNVYISNAPAVSLYRALGFTVSAVDETRGSYAMSLHVPPRPNA